LDLKHLLKRGALLTAANWQTVAIQFVAETTFYALLAVPIIGAAIWWRCSSAATSPISCRAAFATSSRRSPAR
jgi:hypothetical protein